jgi:hypothetical protein
MKEQSDHKAKATTTIKSTPVEQSKPSKDELSEQELAKASGGGATVGLGLRKSAGGNVTGTF